MVNISTYQPLLTDHRQRQHYASIPTFFDSLCLSQSPQRHVVSRLYSEFFSTVSPKADKACSAWEKEFRLALTAEEWENINCLTHTASRDVLTQENGYKLCSRWDRTPSILHKFLPQQSDHSWWYEMDEETLLHIWWTARGSVSSGKRSIK